MQNQKAVNVMRQDADVCVVHAMQKTVVVHVARELAIIISPVIVCAVFVRLMVAEIKIAEGSNSFALTFTGPRISGAF